MKVTVRKSKPKKVNAEDLKPGELFVIDPDGSVYMRNSSFIQGQVEATCLDTGHVWVFVPTEKVLRVSQIARLEVEII